MATITAADGTALYVEAHGDGIPLVFSCALITTHENWRPQVAPLVAAGARVILWDYRGHGLSSAPTDPDAYSMEQVVDDLGRVLDWAAPGQTAVLGGLSFGGLASLHFTLRHPERVRGLLLVDSGPGFKNPKAQECWAQATERTAAFVEKTGQRVYTAKADVRDAAQLKKALDDGIAQMGGLDIVVAQAGIAGMKGDPPMQAWTDVINTNLVGTINAIQVALPHLKFVHLVGKLRM